MLVTLLALLASGLTLDVGIGLQDPAECPARGEKPFAARTGTVGGTSHCYRVFVPPAWTAETPWPVILFLHGSGALGTDNVRQIRSGLDTAIRRDLDRFAFIVVFPQIPRGHAWWEPEMEARALDALDRTLREFNGDPRRVYLTGKSLGGFGTWYVGADHPARFAALVPVSGGVASPEAPAGSAGGDTSAAAARAAVARRIGKTPVWVFHGRRDHVTPVAEASAMVAALEDAGGTVRYTEYAGMGHDAWRRAYADPQLFAWLLQQRLE